MLETLLDYEDRIIRVQSYIRDNLDSDLSLRRLADEACFSQYHFHRIFTAMVGESVKKYVRRLRLERAAWILLTTKKSVLDIALNSGYETHESFSRAFKSQFGFPPKNYRDSQKDAENRKRIETLGLKTILTRNRIRGEIMDVKIKKIETMTVAAVRHTGPYTECHPAWETLMGNKVLQGTLNEHSVFLGVCHDDPDNTEPEKLRYDACMVIDSDLELGPDTTKLEIEGGEFASFIHKGSYANLKDTYQALYGDWLPKSGREPQSAPCLEVYLNNPDTVEKEEDLLTEIRIPLQ